VRTRVLLVAPGVNRDDIGEAWVGYQWASRLAEQNDVTLLTYRKRSRPTAVDQLPGVEVVEWLEPRLLGRAERFNSLLKPWYPLFHRRCRQWIAEALDSGRSFDVAHQPTPVAMRYPSPLAHFDIPYLIGPVGGSLSTPPGFRDQDTAPWYLQLRRLDDWRLRHDRALRRSFSRATAVLGIAPYVSDALAPVPLRGFVTMSETAIESVPPPVDRDRDDGTVRLLFVGRLIRTKGARDAVAALAHLRDLPVRLDVVGDGFDRAACQTLAAELGVTDAVTFHGAQPRAQVEEFYDRSDVFVFPSYREPGGNVPFEAMSHGLALVVADRGGPAQAVDESCALLVSPTSPDSYARDIAAAVRSLVTDPSRRRRMGEAARRRVVESGTWAARVADVERLYAEAVQRAARPVTEARR
jgi:glycosyltransferase involved in cell wall biosynthesis